MKGLLKEYWVYKWPCIKGCMFSSCYRYSTAFVLFFLVNLFWVPLIHGPVLKTGLSLFDPIIINNVGLVLGILSLLVRFLSDLIFLRWPKFSNKMKLVIADKVRWFIETVMIGMHALIGWFVSEMIRHFSWHDIVVMIALYLLVVLCMSTYCWLEKVWMAPRGEGFLKDQYSMSKRMFCYFAIMLAIILVWRLVHWMPFVLAVLSPFFILALATLYERLVSLGVISDKG